MSGDTYQTLIGNLAADPELRFTPSGAAVASFRILSTPRSFDRLINEWKDGDTLAINCSVWREQAENVAQSLTKGTKVIAHGRLTSRSYETTTGEKRTVIELAVETIGPSLERASAVVTRAMRGPSATRPGAADADPWAAGAAGAGDAGGASW